MIEKSPTIGALAAALAKAQGEMKGAAKDATNPHFKSRYADLAGIWEACRTPLSKNELAVSQLSSADGPIVSVTSLLMHASGEWMQSELRVLARDAGPQSVGSAITYARRYSLASLVGVAPDDDDDGNAGQSGSFPRNSQPQAIKSSSQNGAGRTTLTAVRQASPVEVEASEPDDDPLPAFEQRQSEETPEEIEAQEAELIAEMKRLWLACSDKPEAEALAEWQAYWIEKSIQDWTRGRKRSWIEKMEPKAQALAAARASNQPKAEEVFDGKKPEQPKPSHAAQAADGSMKLLRKDESGNLVPQWQKPTPPTVEADAEQILTDTAAQGFETPSHKRLDELITHWNGEGGQSFDAINQKIAAVTGGKYELDELDEAEAAKACGALSNWNPTADAQVGRKGSKKK